MYYEIRQEYGFHWFVYRPVSPIVAHMLLPLPQYEIYVTTPSVLTGGLIVNFVVQLGANAVAEHWKVALYKFTEDISVNIGDLTGGELLVPFTLGTFSSLLYHCFITANH